MRLLAPAKINLHLRVGALAPSGYHPVVTWMCTVGLFDTLTIRPTDDGSISLRSNDPALPLDARNLVYRAAQSLRDAAPGAQPHGAAIVLEKHIPTGGGLGGGSSDAARTLLGLNRSWGIGLSTHGLHEIASRLGSDVPFFLHGPSSACTGRGEVV